MRFKEYFLLEEFNQNVLKYYCDKILSYLSYPYNLFDNIETAVYSLLTTKSKNLPQTFIQKYEKKYEETLEMLQYPHFEKSKSAGWVHFSSEKDSSNIQKRGVGVAGKYVYAVDYKRYATFKSQFLVDDNPNGPSIIHAWSDVRAFLGMLSGLSKRLWDLAEEFQDHVQFKINNTLEGLLEHTDNIVVHYTKPELGDKVVEALRISAREVGVKLDSRDHRSWRGYDLSPSGKVPSSPIQKGGSYSQIIAKRITNELLAKKDQFKTSDQIKNFILQTAPELLNQSPQSMVTYFH
jgi:hypothetical protein